MQFPPPLLIVCNSPCGKTLFFWVGLSSRSERKPFLSNLIFIFMLLTKCNIAIKVIYPKYSKHWLSTVANTIDRLLFCLMNQFYLMYRLICQEPAHFCLPKWLWWAPFFKCLEYLGCLTLYCNMQIRNAQLLCYVSWVWVCK